MVNFLKQFFQKHILLSILLIGLVHGLIYVFLVPPWQHYDEMGHFEYAWMIADQGRIPDAGEFDNDLRAEMLKSMKENRFFDLQKYAKPLENWADDQYPIWIGITQVGDPPLYYLIVAIFLKFFERFSIDIQLFLGRMVSLVFFEGILLVAYYFGKELFSKRSNFFWIFPLSLALFPAFVDNMTAFNNDVAAVFFTSLVIFYGVKIIKNQRDVKSLIIFLGLTVLLYFVKVSVWVVVIPALLLFVFILLSKIKKLRPRMYVLAGVFLIFVSIIILFDFDDAALWYRRSVQLEPSRIETDFGPAISIKNIPGQFGSALYQTISMDQVDDLTGQVVTLGAWMWAEQKTTVIPPSLMVFDTKFQQRFIQPETTLEIGATPAFYSTHYQLPEDLSRVAAVLYASSNDDSMIYYQYPILTIGEFPGNVPPNRLDNAVYDWNGINTTNLIRNDLLKQRWPRFSPLVLRVFNKIDYRISEAANWVIYVLDIKGGGWYTKVSVENVFRTFWGKFGWGHVLLKGKNPYWYPFLFSLAGIISVGYHYSKKMDLKKLFILSWFGLVLISLSFFTWFSGVSMQSYFGPVILPGARFIYPAIFIILTIIIQGWCLIINDFHQKRNILMVLLMIIFYVYLNINSFVTVYRYFY